MLKKIVTWFKGVFATPNLSDIKPDWTMGDIVRYFDNQNEEKSTRIAWAEFHLQKEALQKQLILQHRTMIIALITMLISSSVAIAAIVVALGSRQNVIVKVVQLKQ